MAWLVLSPARAGRHDGIGDYAARLTTALQRHSTTRLHVAGDGPYPGDDDVSVVFHQYSPAAPHGRERRDEDRWLGRWARCGRPLVVTVHEYWPPGDGSFRRALLRFRLRRRVQHAVTRATAVVVAQDISASQLTVSGVLGRCPVRVVPVGSNITPGTDSPSSRDGGLLVFGQPAAMNAPVMRAIARWRATPGPHEPLTWISRSAEEVRDWWVRVAGGRPDDIHCLGGVPEADVSSHLHAATLALAPYADGASARRTTLAALLQHGAPTLALDGLATDEWLRRDGGLAWVPDRDPGAFVAAIADLLRDPDRRAVLSSAARAAYVRHMSWPVIADAYVRAWQDGKRNDT
jgi:hypothetical protein